MELWETYFCFATNNKHPSAKPDMPFQKITPKFINKIFISGETNDHFIQIAC